MPRSMYLHTEIYPNLKSISELFKMYMKSFDSFILASRDNWVSCNQTLGCLRLYGDIRVARAQSRINAYDILLQHDWLLIFSRHKRFAETHSHLQLSYHLTDRLLAAGNNGNRFKRWTIFKIRPLCINFSVLAFPQKKINIDSKLMRSCINCSACYTIMN